MVNHAWPLSTLLRHCDSVKTEINGEWVPCRPVNFTRRYASLRERLWMAWKVFRCDYDVFFWPNEQSND